MARIRPMASTRFGAQNVLDPQCAGEAPTYAIKTSPAPLGNSKERVQIPDAAQQGGIS